MGLEPIMMKQVEVVVFNALACRRTRQRTGSLPDRP
jgi:hypothetical protein